MDFWPHVHDFWAPKPTPKPKKRKHEKPMFYLRKTYVLEGPGLSFLVQKPWKNGVGTGDGIGGDFFVIFTDFGLQFELRNREKTLKKQCRNRNVLNIDCSLGAACFRGRGCNGRGSGLKLSKSDVLKEMYAFRMDGVQKWKMKNFRGPYSTTY